MLIRSRVFRKYILSYLAVVLAICMVLGLALVRVSTDQLRQAEMGYIRPGWRRPATM